MIRRLALFTAVLLSTAGAALAFPPSTGSDTGQAHADSLVQSVRAQR